MQQRVVNSSNAYLAAAYLLTVLTEQVCYITRWNL